MAKLVFNQRLIRFLNYGSQMNGFIPDVYRIIQQYGICEVINRYVRTGLFPAKCAWTSTVNRSVIIPEKMFTFQHTVGYNIRSNTNQCVKGRQRMSRTVHGQITYQILSNM